jgi:hypothetical protein
VPRSLEEARRQHESDAAALEALYADPAFLEETRRAVREADAHGTAGWPTLDDVRDAYGLHDEA